MKEKITEISDLEKFFQPFFIHQKAYRKIYGYEIEGKKIFIKMYLSNLEEGEREWENLKLLSEMGYPVPTPLFFKKEKERVFIATEALMGTPLSEILPDSQDSELYLKALAELLSQLHKNSLFHQDCYLNHFYWDEASQKLSFLDVARVKSSKVFAFYYQVKDLSQLGYSFEEYLGQRGPIYFQVFLKFYEKNMQELSIFQKILLKFKISRIRKRTIKRRLKGKPL
ncbi:MAG: lipopolysaccharide kinase InaA family protein [Caldimicrobium sp.]